MFEKIYKSSIIEKPKFTLLILIILLLSFGYFSKNFQLDASSDTLLLENDPDLKYLREVNSEYGSKDFLVLTYTPINNLLDPNTIKNLTNLKNDLVNLKWADNVITILDVPLLKNNDDPLAERIKNFKTLSSKDADKERGFDEIINSPIYKEFVISNDGKTSGILVYIKSDKQLSQFIKTKIYDVRKRLPFDNNTIDGCFSHMLYCMALSNSDIKNLNKEILRILKPGGVNIYTVRHTDDGDYKSGIHVGEDLYENDGFIVHFFSKDKINQFSNGFDIVDIEKFEEGKFPRKLFKVILKKKLFTR